MNPVAPISDPNDQFRQNSRDSEYLNLLSIFYYVMAGLTALGGLAFGFQIVMGLIIAGSAIGPTATVAVNPSNFPGAPTPTPVIPAPGPPSLFGGLIVGIGVFALIACGVMAYFTYLAGRSLARREKKMLIQVVAAILCLNFPFGTALGVCTFLVLGRPSVEALFAAPRSS